MLYSNTPISADSAEIRCLHSLESDLTSKLAYHPGGDAQPVEIYLLADRNAYSHFLKFYFPELPSRRAFFLAQDHRRVVYTFLQNDHLEEDLRHEGTHALVRGCYGDLPLWLDEGLAEYFETRSDAIGLQDEHLERLRDDLKQGWKPDLPRLESLTDIHQLSPRDYRESWAWVHLMLEPRSPGDSLLVSYLNQEQGAVHPKPVSGLLSAHGKTDKDLLAHLETIDSEPIVHKPSPSPPSRSSTIRLQDLGPDFPERGFDATPVQAPAPRPGLLRRFGSWLGF